MSDTTVSEDDNRPFRLNGSALQTSKDVAAYLGTSHGQLIWTLYKAPENSRYVAFEIPKRSGGMRPIHAPIGLLRQLQEKLNIEFQALYRPHPNAHGFLKERSIVTNAKEHVGKRWVLNVDLLDFFPSVNFGRIRGLFMKPPFDMAPAAATVCAQIVTHRNGLPQGAPTSPVLSNFIAATLDRRLLRLARQNRLAYSRYADDITFSSNAQTFPPALATREVHASGIISVEAGDELVLAIAQSGFAVNPAKVRISSHTAYQSVTGLCVNARINVGRRRVRRIRAMLHAWRKFGIEAAAREHFLKYRGARTAARPIDAERAFRNVVYGQLSFVRMVRGPDDPVFLNLCAQILELDPNPSKLVRKIVFGADDYDVFISHASEDKETVARPIFAACERLGLKVFLDEEHIGWGQSFTSKINTALGSARTVLAIISSNSVNKEWPLLEVNTALSYEASGSKRVIPVLVGRPDLSKLPLIRSKRWVDWKENADEVAWQVARTIQETSDVAAQNMGGGHRQLRSASTKTDGVRKAVALPESAASNGVNRQKGFWSRFFGRGRGTSR